MRNRSLVVVALTLVFVTVTLVSIGAASAATRLSETKVVPRVLACSGKAEVEPSSYTVFCGDGNGVLLKIGWTSWTPTSARARATYSVNDCTPDCAAGKFRSYPATVTLSVPKHTKYGVLFSLLKVVYTNADKRHSFTQPLPLRPL